MLALHLLALLPLASALAITSPNPLAIAKRTVSYKTYTDPKQGNNDYCGEHNPNTSTTSSSPLAADCKVIADTYTDFSISPTEAQKGYWTVDKSDFVSSSDGYVTLAKSGTCQFRIKDIKKELDTVYFGANDLRFYMRWALLSPDSAGRVEAFGAVSCNAGKPGVSADFEYRVTHV
ncbi:hypothetical protein QBC39DRAFT_258895 [Podospora conica]|nr:hypothetical protein QBC39DRAFT_258895 [Schizothecium conicum]